MTNGTASVKKNRTPSAMRLERIRLGVRLADVAREIGVSVGRLSMAERGLAQLTELEEGRRVMALRRHEIRAEIRGQE